mgnify:FL=1
MSTTILEIMKLRQSLEDGPTPGTVGGLAGLLAEKTFNGAAVATVTRQRWPENFQQLRPRVELKVAIGAATGRCHIFSDKSRAFDAWSFSLAIQCVTAPNPDPASNSAHE